MDTLCAVGEIIDQHSSSKVVIGGDFNFVQATIALRAIVACYCNFAFRDSFLVCFLAEQICISH